jgi:nitroreductase
MLATIPGMFDFTPADDDLARTIRGRRTINDFLPEPAPREILLQAIELARWAPNHKLTEPWRFHLLGPQTAETLIQLNSRLVAAGKGEEVARKKTERWRAVPGWLAVSCRISADRLRDQEDYAAVCCAIQNLMLFLWSQGIGTKWSTGDVIRHPDALSLLGLDPARDRIVGLIWYGRPAQVPQMKRQPVAEMTRLHP